MNCYFNKMLILLVVILSASFNVFAAQKTLKIEVRIAKDSPVEKALLELAKEMEGTAKLYQTTNQKAYWENEGRESFGKLLRSEGYYASTIDVEIPDSKINSIIFHIDSWKRYKIANVAIKYIGTNKDCLCPEIEDIKIKKGQNAVAKDILEAQRKIIKYIEQNNCLLSLSITHKAIVDHLDDNVSITFLVDAGQTATIKNVKFNGLEDISPFYVRKLVKLKDGQCFKNSYIIKSRGLLQKSGLFASTNPFIPEKTDEDGSVPVVFNLTQRKAKSIKAGVGFGTDLGLGASLGWEHRNFFGSGEKVVVDLSGNQREQILSLNYTKPFYRRDDQTLRLGSVISNKQTKAYKGKEASISAFLEREFTEKWSGGLGVRFAQSKIEESDKKRVFSLLSTPIFITQDTRNNILDPKRGHEIKIEGAPFFNVKKTEKPFLKAKISGSTYFAFKTKYKTILAVRGGVGSIFGIKELQVPPPVRYYVGGSNSLRGYGYQLAGKLDSKRSPIGGRSFVETSVELRVKFTKAIGMVAFLDSGRAYTTIRPTAKEKLLQGVGFGLRYITDFGPVRADIGFPLRKRKINGKTVDDSYQLYFGIGQTF